LSQTETKQVHNSDVVYSYMYATQLFGFGDDDCSQKKTYAGFEGKVYRFSLPHSLGSVDDPLMADLACSLLGISAVSDSGVSASGRDRSTSIHNASPELVAQVSQLEALLSRQRADLNDLAETDSTLPGQADEEEDDDLAAEIAELAESEKLLRRELEQLMLAGQLQLKSNHKVWMTSVRADPNILSNNIRSNDPQRGWGLRWHVTIRISLALVIFATIMLSRLAVFEHQGEWIRKALVVSVPEDVDSALVAFKPSTSERSFPGVLQVFDFSTAEPSVHMPAGTSEASDIISVASSSRTPSSNGQTMIACSTLATIPCNYERPQRRSEEVDWKQIFTKASLLLTSTWSYVDRFAPAVDGQHV
jgi:hypothetical protein